MVDEYQEVEDFENLEVPLTSTWNQVLENIRALYASLNPLANMQKNALVSMSGSQNVTNTAPNIDKFTFTTEVVDGGGFWSAGAPTKFTIPDDGLYLIGFDWVETSSSGSGGTEYIGIVKNGGAWFTELVQESVGAYIATSDTKAGVLQLEAGDYIELGMYRTNSGTAAMKCRMWIQRLPG